MHLVREARLPGARPDGCVTGHVTFPFVSPVPSEFITHIDPEGGCENSMRYQVRWV